MANKSPYPYLAALCLVAILVALGSISCAGPGSNTQTNTSATKSPAPDPCSAVTDAQIIDVIYGRIIRKSAELAAQVRQINVTSKDRHVTLIGWVGTEDEKAQVIEIATKTECVIDVNSSNFHGQADNPTRPQSGTCTGDTVKCGDICIPSPPGGCSLSALTAPAGATATAQSNSNANTRVNANTNTTTTVNSSNTNTAKKP